MFRRERKGSFDLGIFMEKALEKVLSPEVTDPRFRGLRFNDNHVSRLTGSELAELALQDLDQEDGSLNIISFAMQRSFVEHRRYSAPGKIGSAVVFNRAHKDLTPGRIGRHLLQIAEEITRAEDTVMWAKENNLTVVKRSEFNDLLEEINKRRSNK